MANELTERNKNLVAIASGGEIGELIKPMVNEIHLFDTFVAGTAHLKDPSVLDGISEGDRLTLVREESKFDDNAIMILTESRQKIGYIPEKDNVIFSRLMDAGKLLIGKVSSVRRKGTFIQISIGIFLMDF